MLFKVGGAAPNEAVALPKGITVRAHAFTVSARTAIEVAAPGPRLGESL